MFNTMLKAGLMAVLISQTFALIDPYTPLDSYAIWIHNGYSNTIGPSTAEIIHLKCVNQDFPFSQRVCSHDPREGFLFEGVLNDFSVSSDNSQLVVSYSHEDLLYGSDARLYLLPIKKGYIDRGANFEPLIMDPSTAGEVHVMGWFHPSGQSVVYSWSGVSTLNTNKIALFDLRTNFTIKLSDGRSTNVDANPFFTPDGQYLLFFSDRVVSTPKKAMGYSTLCVALPTYASVANATCFTNTENLYSDRPQFVNATHILIRKQTTRPPSPTPSQTLSYTYGLLGLVMDTGGAVVGAEWNDLMRAECPGVSDGCVTDVNEAGSGCAANPVSDEWEQTPLLCVHGLGGIFMVHINPVNHIEQCLGDGPPMVRYGSSCKGVWHSALQTFNLQYD